MDQPTVVLEPAADAPAAPDAAPAARRARPRWPGVLSFALAVLTVAGLVTGMVLVVQDSYVEATWAAWIASGAGAVAVLVALVAIIGRFGRGWAVAGLVLGVVANPPVLTWALDAIEGLWA